MIGLGAVAFGFVLSLGDTAITGDIVQQFLDSTGEAEVEGLGHLLLVLGSSCLSSARQYADSW